MKKNYRFVTPWNTTIACFYTIREGVEYCQKLFPEMEYCYTHRLKAGQWKCDALKNNKKLILNGPTLDRFFSNNVLGGLQNE